MVIESSVKPGDAFFVGRRRIVVAAVKKPAQVTSERMTASHAPWDITRGRRCLTTSFSRSAKRRQTDPCVSSSAHRKQSWFCGTRIRTALGKACINRGDRSPAAEGHVANWSNTAREHTKDLGSESAL
jgi:hypothetical protein